MAELSETRATLRFFGDDLDPDEISRLLGKAPTAAERKGQIIRGKKSGRERIARQGGWRLGASDAFPGNLDAQVNELLDGATVDLSVWLQLSRTYRGNVFCGLFLRESNQGLSVSPLTLVALGERGLILDLDIYGADLDPATTMGETI